VGVDRHRLLRDAGVFRLHHDGLDAAGAHRRRGEPDVGWADDGLGVAARAAGEPAHPAAGGRARWTRLLVGGPGRTGGVRAHGPHRGARRGTAVVVGPDRTGHGRVLVGAQRHHDAGADGGRYGVAVGYGAGPRVP